MKRLGRGLLIGVISLTVLLTIAITFTVGWSPFLGPRTRARTNRTFERTPQRLERGRYIANAWSGCFDCHTPHDWTAAGTPLVAGMEGAGAMINWPAPFAKGSDMMAAPFFP